MGKLCCSYCYYYFTGRWVGWVGAGGELNVSPGRGRRKEEMIDRSSAFVVATDSTTDGRSGRRR